MDQLANLPPLALITFGATMALIVAVQRLGIWQGARAAPASSATTAQVAAVVVDPTALNKASSVLSDHAEAVRDLTETLGEVTRKLSILAIEVDRGREEMRLERELRREMRRDPGRSSSTSHAG